MGKLLEIVKRIFKTYISVNYILSFINNNVCAMDEERYSKTLRTIMFPNSIEKAFNNLQNEQELYSKFKDTKLYCNYISDFCKNTKDLQCNFYQYKYEDVSKIIDKCFDKCLKLQYPQDKNLTHLFTSTFNNSYEIIDYFSKKMINELY